MKRTESGREIHYFGEEYSDEIIALKKNTSVRTADDFFELLLKCWCRETAFPSTQQDYDYINDPTYGQCAVTAMLVHDVFGGTIHKIRVDGGGTHYFNKINGRYIDLTRDQFDLYEIPISYEPNQQIDRDYCGKNANTKKRFDLLKQRIIDYIRDPERKTNSPKNREKREGATTVKQQTKAPSWPDFGSKRRNNTKRVNVVTGGSIFDIKTSGSYKKANKVNTSARTKDADKRAAEVEKRRSFVDSEIHPHGVRYGDAYRYRKKSKNGK